MKHELHQVESNIQIIESKLTDNENEVKRLTKLRFDIETRVVKLKASNDEQLFATSGA